VRGEFPCLGRHAATTDEAFVLGLQFEEFAAWRNRCDERARPVATEDAKAIDRDG
jgi:hypothetical protein